MSQAELWTRNALVVVHDDGVAHLLQFILHGDGYAVQRVRDAHHARIAVGQKLPPDLVVVDLILPDGTAADVVGTMRAAADWQRVPVLLIGGAAHESIDPPGVAFAGGVAYTEKPVRPEEVRACISRLLNQRALHRVHRRATVSLLRHGRRYG